MNYELKKEKGVAKFEISISATEWDEELNLSYNKNKGKYNVQGFRKGQAPRKIIEKFYGAGVFFDDAFDSCASKAYSKALDENRDVIPVDEPKVNITDFGGEGKDFKFSMSVVTKPEVVLGKYSGIKIDKVEYNVVKADVDSELEKARERASRLVEITDRAVQNGDTVKLDYSGSIDGVKFAGGTAENQTLVIGSNSFIPGFEEQMIGMEIGSEKDLQVKFPDEYHAEDIKGKDAVFNVKVHGISVKELPELNDEFAKDTSKFDSLDEYTRDIESRLKEENERRAKTENENKLVEKIVENTNVEIPDCMIESELDYMLQDFEYRLMYMYQGLKLDDYFKHTGSSKEDFKKERRGEAERAVKTRLILQEIVKAEKLEVTDEDIDEHIKKAAEKASKEFEEYKKSLDANKLNGMKNEIIVTKLMDFLTNNNEFVVGLGEDKKADKEEKDEKVEKPSSKKTSAKKTAKE